MTLCIKCNFRGSYTCWFNHPTYIKFVKNSDINPMQCYEVKMLLCSILEEAGLNPICVNFSKSVRDLVHSVNSFLRKSLSSFRVKYL